MIKFRCPSCQTKLGVPDEYVNRRIRCNKCGQACVVPEPIAETPIQPSIQPTSKAPAVVATTPPDPASIQPQHASAPGTSEGLDFIDDSQMEIQEDPNAAILRQIQKDKAAKQKIKKSDPAKPINTGSAKPGRRERTKSEFSLTDIVPDALHFPLSLVLGLLAVCAFIRIWIVAAQKAHNPLTFFTMLISWAAAGGIRLLAVNRTFALGTLAAAMGLAGICLGRVVVAKTVIIPLLHEQASQEILKKLPQVLADPKMQIPQGESAKSIVQNSGFMGCIAIIAAVDQDDADPVIARQIALYMVQRSDKSLIEKAAAAGTAPRVEEFTPEDAERMMKTQEELEKNKNNPEALKKIIENNKSKSNADAAPLTEEQLQQQTVMKKADEYLATWQDDKSAALNAARKYYPALAELRMQSKLLKILQDPQQAFHFALLMTLGILDMAWLLAGFCGAYVLAAYDI